MLNSSWILGNYIFGVCVFVFIIFSIMGSSISILPTLVQILNKCKEYSQEYMTKQKLIFYCNAVWMMYYLESDESWPLNGSLNLYTILQLGVFCQRARKDGEIPYVQASYLNIIKILPRKKSELMVQRQREKPKIFLMMQMKNRTVRKNMWQI